MTKINISASEEAKLRAHVREVIQRPGPLSNLPISKVEEAIRVRSSSFSSLTEMRDEAKRVADLTGFRSGFFGVPFTQLIPFLNDLLEKGEEIEGCNFRQY